MNKLQEYHTLSKNLRKARRAMRAKRWGITAYQQECVLDNPNTPIRACINRFERVYGVSKNPNVYDGGDFVICCSWFDELPCVDTKCPMYSKNLEYTVAVEKFNAARDARRAFVKNIFRGRAK